MYFICKITSVIHVLNKRLRPSPSSLSSSTFSSASFLPLSFKGMSSISMSSLVSPYKRKPLY